MPKIESTAGATTGNTTPLRGSVRIWKVPLSLSSDTIARCENFLSPEEIEKSKRILLPKDQARFIISRGTLRTILSRYVNEHPGNLVFGYGAHGKPFLTHPPTASSIQFNVSHCIDMAIIAVSSSRHLGIDVEKVRALPELKHILERFFSRQERVFVESMNDEIRDRAFFQIWTRREAAAKALGLDLSAALSDLGIPFFAPGNGIRLEHVRNAAQDLQSGKNGWFLQDLQIDASHVGAICSEGESCEITFHDFKDASAETSAPV